MTKDVQNKAAQFFESGVSKPRLARITANLTSTPAQSAIQQGIDCYHQGQFEEALSHFAAASSSATNDPRVFAYSAFICAENGLHAEAAAFLEQALQMAPGAVEYMAALGEVFLKKGDASTAIGYLQNAIENKPDLFSAYPALAEALRQDGRHGEAIHLLQCAVFIESPAQFQILVSLIEMLALCGDTTSLASLCRRFPENPALHSLAIRLLARTGASPEQLFEEANIYSERNLLGLEPEFRLPRELPDNRPARIAFLLSDFQREDQLGRLEALLTYLPPERFETTLICNDPAVENSEAAQRYSLLADHWLAIQDFDEQRASAAVEGLGLDFLIDLDGHGTKQRLSLVCYSETPFKATWPDMPIPVVAGPSLTVLYSTALGEEALAFLPHNQKVLGLNHIGEVLRPPPAGCFASKVAKKTGMLGCLTPANQVGRDTWLFFADLLTQLPDTELTLNLSGLGEPAERFIGDLFVAKGLARERLRFISATTDEDTLQAWQDIQLGLAPLCGHGASALPLALWANVPFVALDNEAPWSRRPAALLRGIGLSNLVAADPPAFIRLVADLLTNARADELNPRSRVIESKLTSPTDFAERFVSLLDNWQAQP